jgi:hypothetical protein
MTKIAGSGSGSTSQRHGSADPDPDPPQNFMAPEHLGRRMQFIINSEDFVNIAWGRLLASSILKKMLDC